MTSTVAEQVRQYVDCVFADDDLVEVRLLSSGKSSWYAASALPAFADTFARENEAGQHVFVGANPRKEQGKRGDGNVELARCLFADFDNATIEDATAAIDAAHLPPPTLTINSGHGVHAFWRFDEPCDDLTLWRGYQKQLIVAVNSDPAIHNPERLMRLPGFVNVKPPAAPCEIVEAEPTRVYAWADVLGVLPPAKVNGNGQAHHGSNGNGKIPEGGRNAFLTSLAGSMRRRGMSEAAILAALLAENSARCSPPLERGEVEQIARSVGRYPAADDDKAEPDELKPISLGQIWADHPTPRQPIIDGLLRRGQVGNLVSASKAYKTYLVLGLAINMVEKRQWLDRFPCAGGRVLVMDMELQEPDITKRTQDIVGAIHADPTRAADIQVVSLRGKVGAIDRIEKLLLQYKPGDFDLVILDPLYKTYPDQFDENSNAAMTRLYQRFERLAEHLDCAMLIIHHGSKGNQSDKRVVDVGSGASAMSRSADAHIVLREHEEDDAIVFDARVRSFPPLEPMVLRWSYPAWQRDLTLDPDDLRTGRNRTRKVEADEPKEEPWTAARFVAAFVTAEPQTRTLIEARARQAGIKGRALTDLIAISLAEKSIFEWSFSTSNAVFLATREQTVVESAESLGKTKRKSTKRGSK